MWSKRSFVSAITNPCESKPALQIMANPVKLQSEQAPKHITAGSSRHAGSSRDAGRPTDRPTGRPAGRIYMNIYIYI